MLQSSLGSSYMSRYFLPALASLVFQAGLMGQSQSTTSLAVLPNASTFGQPVTLTATVTSGATGKVTFYDGVTVLGIGTVSGTQASLTTVMLPPGNRKLLAYYSGDASYAPSSSAAQAEVVAATPSLGFHKVNSYTTTASPSSLVTGDVNGDGKQDLIAANGYAGSVTVYLGNGDGTFQAGTTYTAGGSPASSVAIGDFNGDGKMDLAVPLYNAGKVSILLGNGDGTFQAAASYSVGSYMSNVVVADFNGDGKADLVLWGSNSANLVVMLGKGDGTFQSPTTVTLTATIVGLTIADLNGDGLADFVVASGNAIGVLLGKGDGTFQAQQTTPTANNFYAYSVFAGDFNGDGLADILATGSNGIDFLPGKGDGTFSTPVYSTTAASYSSALAGDFNGDGRLDVALLNAYSYNTPSGYVVEILPGNGDGTFSAPVLFPVASNAGVGVIGEFNGDGTLDIAATSNGGYSILLGGAVPDLTISASHGGGLTQSQQGAEYILTVNNSGDFVTVNAIGVVANLPATVTPTSIAGTGWTCTLSTLACTRSDLLAPSASYPPIYLRFNISAGVTGNLTSSFAVGGGGETNTANDSTSDTTLLRTPTSITLSSSPNPSTLGHAVTLTASIDSSVTGRMEFYAGTALLGSAPISGGQSILTTTLLPSGANSLQAFYPGNANYGPSFSATRSQTVTATSDTGIQPYTSYPVDTTPNWIVSGDLNGDGKTDLVTANGAATISVLLGAGNGTFRTSVKYSLGSNTGTPTAAVIGDFNNDGKMDVAVVANAGVYLFAGNGDGTFGPVQTVVSTSTYYYTTYTGLAVADFNGDGNLDLATINGGAVTLLLGSGDGTFQAPTMLLSGSTSYGTVYVADINVDGKPDLVAVAGDSNLTVLIGNGDGTFQSPVNTTISISGAGGLAIGDFNGDGRPDLAATYWVGVSLLAGNGDGTFKAPVQSSISSTPGYYTAAGDFNGDGKLDIAYSGYYSPNINLAFGRGDGTFQAGPTLQVESYPNTIVLGDFNNDGMPDFAVANSNTSTVDVFLGQRISGLSIMSSHIGRFVTGQSGTYQITVTNSQFSPTTGLVTVTDTLPYGFTASSITGSGWTCTVSPLSCTRSDVLNTTQTYPSITLVVNVSASLTPAVFPNNVSVTTSGVVNFFADNTTLVSPASTTVTATPNPATLGQPVTLTATVTSGATGSVLFLSNGVPVGRAAISGIQATLTTSVLPAGRLLLTATYSGDGTHGFSSSTGTLLTVTAFATSGFSTGAAYTTGSGPMQVALGDFNHDGSLDLVATNSNDNTVSVLLAKGDGTFNAKTDYAVGTRPTAVLVNDLNNDGYPDIAVVNGSSSNISILLNNGNGTFQPAVNYPAANAAYLASTDFNGDGNVDLMIFNQYYSNLEILMGNGAGTFKATYPLSGTAYAGAIGDFNRDGKIDIVTNNGMFLGNGDGTFQATNLLGISWGSTTITGDLNSDGKLDLVSAASGTVYVTPGKGDGTFQPSVSYSAPSAYNATLADVNGDGKLDVIVFGNGIPSVLLGNGDGTLQASTNLPGSSSSSFVAAGDLNGDGRTDLVIASGNNGNTVTVLYGILTPVFTITSSHSDPFSVGQSGATYTVTVKNNGPGVPSGPLTVTDTLPTGFTATAISGSGWTCTLASVSCTRSDSVGVGSSYLPITVAFTVASASTGLVMNQVSVVGGGAVAANSFDATTVNAPPTVIQTNPAGLQFTLDGGAPQTAPQTLSLSPGSHTVAVTSTQAGSAGTQYVFTAWSDSGAASHTITVGATSTTYIATFKTQYQLTTAALPVPGGSVTAGGWVDAGTTVTVSATPTSPYVFSGWTGGATANPLQVTVNAPNTMTAAFNVPGFTCAIQTGGAGLPSAPDFQKIINEALGIAAPNDDLNRDLVVNVADVQKVLQAALGAGCIY